MGRKVFTRERLTSADVNAYLMEQAVMRFASASARDTDLPSPVLGMVAFLESVERYYWWNGSAWQYLGGAPAGPSTFALTGFTHATGRTAQGRVTAGSMIELSGAIVNAGNYTPPSGVFATLPAGWAPEVLKNFAIATSAGNMVANLEIATSGAMRIFGPSVAVTGFVTYALDGVIFSPLAT